MAELSVILFVVAAIGGAVMAVQRLRGAERPPTPLALAHGALAAVALILYVIALAGADDPPAAGIWGTVVLVVAAIGGGVMFLGFHQRQRALPVPFVLGHGVLAVIGVILLLVAVFGGGNGNDAAPAY